MPSPKISIIFFCFVLFFVVVFVVVVFWLLFSGRQVTSAFILLSILLSIVNLVLYSIIHSVIFAFGDGPPHFADYLPMLISCSSFLNSSVNTRKLELHAFSVFFYTFFFLFLLLNFLTSFDSYWFMLIECSMVLNFFHE